jgi:hypothetical protein
MQQKKKQVAVPPTCDGHLIKCKNKADPVHAIKADATEQFYRQTFLTFLVNGQLDAQFFSMYLFQFCACFEQPSAQIIRRNKCINTTSGIRHCVSVTVSCAVTFRPAHETVTDTE